MALLRLLAFRIKAPQVFDSTSQRNWIKVGGSNRQERLYHAQGRLSRCPGNEAAHVKNTLTTVSLPLLLLVSLMLLETCLSTMLHGAQLWRWNSAAKSAVWGAYPRWARVDRESIPLRVMCNFAGRYMQLCNHTPMNLQGEQCTSKTCKKGKGNANPDLIQAHSRSRFPKWANIQKKGCKCNSCTIVSVCKALQSPRPLALRAAFVLISGWEMVEGKATVPFFALSISLGHLGNSHY